jgi:hypothetical protein
VGLYQITVKFKITVKVGSVFGISPVLVWREMTLEEAQISDTHSLKGTTLKNETSCSGVKFEFIKYKYFFEKIVT